MEELNEVMVNETETEDLMVIDEDVEIETVETGKGWKIGAIVGGVALAGYGIYKGVKWAIGKIKTKKAEKAKINEAEVVDTEFEEVEETDE